MVFFQSKTVEVSFLVGKLSSSPCSLLEWRRQKAKTPMIKLTGAFVLATSYSRTAYRRTTIGAVAFHFRVRNGNGWYHYANVTRILRRRFGAEFW